MARALTKGGDRLRIFAHYVLGRLIFLFFVCHPGTLATCDGQAYLRNRYPNRDLITTEGQMEDHRRHYTPRNAEDFAMKTGVPDELLHGNTDNWTPDWAPSLEQRFHSTVKAWLRAGAAFRSKQAQVRAADTHPPAGLAFVPTPTVRGAMDIRSARANDRQKERWTSLAELGYNPRLSSRLPAHARRAGCVGGGRRHRHLRNAAHPGDTRMLLGLRARGFPLRRGIFGASGKTASNSSAGVDSASTVSTNDVVNVEIEETLGTAAVGTSEDRKLVLSSTKSDSEGDGLLSSLLGGAADAYDTALSFVGCVLITSPLGKRYLNAYDGQNTVPASTIRRSGGPQDMSGNTYDLVGFSNIDPYEASGRRGGGSSSRMLGR